MGRTKGTPKRGVEASQVLGRSSSAVEDPIVEVIENPPLNVTYEAGRQASTRQSKKSPSKRKKLVRKVTFAEASVIPEAEVQLCFEEHKILFLSQSTSSSNDETSSSEAQDDQQEKLIYLESWNLDQWSLVDADKEMSLSSPAFLTTRCGVERILSQVSFTSKDPIDSIIQSVVNGLIHVKLSNESGYVQVSILLDLQNAYKSNNPQVLPVNTSTRKRVPGVALIKAMSLIFPDFETHKHAIDSITATQIYAAVDNVQFNARKDQLRDDLQNIPGLVPKLRPYQQAAVQWMLERELEDCKENEWELAWFYLKDGTLHLLMRGRMDDADALYCPSMGWFCSSYNEARSFSMGSEKVVSGRGGICADSMGLGKTVEVLSLILANPAPISHTSSVQLDSRSQGVPADESDPSLELAAAETTKSVEISDPTIGMCICGTMISIMDKEPFVICEMCSEPMHACCAHTETENSNDWKRLQYRHCSTVVETRQCPEAFCPCCVASKRNNSTSLISSKATLIVTPPAILNQWQREIQRHTLVETITSTSRGTSEEKVYRPLKVLVYPGVRDLCKQGKMKSKETMLLHPRHLAEADIVLMTFESLMADLSHSDDNPFLRSQDDLTTRSLRRRKVYRVIPSPLQSIHWWRICLDEAQRVETPTLGSAKMALKLSTNFRWAVSGTPAAKGRLDDLFGLLVFLRSRPFSNKHWLHKCFNSSVPYTNEMISHLLKQVLWRSTKASPIVAQQMGVPEQVEKVVLLSFSSIERHFYERQLEETLRAATSLPDKRKSRNAIELVSTQLHKLRAACCHPQVGTGGLARITKGSKKRKFPVTNSQGDSDFSSTGIMTMDQILDRLIDDAKSKCEEAQRLALLHNNAMAAISKLKVEAKSRGITVDKTDNQLLAQSCNIYLTSLSLMEDNSKPIPVTSEVVIAGSKGFISSPMKQGKTTLIWNVSAGGDSVWSDFEFNGLGRKLNRIRFSVMTSLPESFGEVAQAGKCTFVTPSAFTLQASSASLGGEYVTVASIDLSTNDTEDNEYVLEGFRSSKAKKWRIEVRHSDAKGKSDESSISSTLFCGIQLEMMEADLSFDSLQRLHVLFNASQSFQRFEEINEQETNKDSSFSPEEVKRHIETMDSESSRIQSTYMASALNLHHSSQLNLSKAVEERGKLEKELLDLNSKSSTGPWDVWCDGWFDDLLVSVIRFGSSREQVEVCSRVQDSLHIASQGAYDQKQFRGKPFPDFNDVQGLYQALKLRLHDMRSKIPIGSVAKLIDRFQQFPTNPDIVDIEMSATCRRCKHDWTWKGAMCRHCQLSVSFAETIPDRLLTMVLGSLHQWMKGMRLSSSLASTLSHLQVHKRADLFFKILESSKKERSAAERSWRVHLTLLNDLDELSMCKRPMRLADEGENLALLSEAELNAVIHPIDLVSSFHDHEAKNAMALANLGRQQSTLRYLRNQKLQRYQEELADSSSEKECCNVCLSAFEGNRAVLSCGHSFHYSPCLTRIMTQPGNRQSISCPLRCALRTKKEDIMICSDKKSDDGSLRDKRVKGSWGTKVTRLISDIMGVSSLGQKSVVFSMWEDMLDIVEEALRMNEIGYVRATSLRKVADSTRVFRSGDCFVLLLNVKNGAEGLTLVEATHVFMVEPLLNHAMDAQSINRIHRIGQTSKTFVHRYLIKDTIEMKINKLRVDRSQTDGDLEDSINNAKHSKFNAGGIDGGFSDLKDLLEVLDDKN